MCARRCARADKGRPVPNYWTRGGSACVCVLCVFNVRLQVMDGYEATRQIRAMERQGSRVPIVGLSADAMERAQAKSNRQLCAESGMDEFRTKVTHEGAVSLRCSAL